MNTYAYIAIIVLVLGVGYWLDSNGYDRAIANQAIAEKAQLKEDAGTVDKLREKEKIREKIVYKWKTKVITDENCYKLTDPLPNIDELRFTYDSIKRPETN